MKIFSEIPMQDIDYTDLDAMWFLCIGTWKFGNDAKKSKIDKCHLAKSSKEHLKNVIDSIWQKAENGDYSNRNNDKVCVGMFGTGFGTFKDSIITETAQLFIKMCVDISEKNSDTDIFDIASFALSNGLKGIGCASISQFLHCLKPFIFPIINGKQGEGTFVYDCLGIYLDEPFNTTKYNDNAQRIYDFRNSNFTFKNFRVMDLMHVEDIFDNKTVQKENSSSASFLKWFEPLLSALKELGGSATPEKARNQIISDLNLSDEVLNETRGKNEAKKFDNEVAWARNYLAYEGIIDKTVRGVWTLTEKGKNTTMTHEFASEIFEKWIKIMQQRRENKLLDVDLSTDDQDLTEISLCWYVGATSSADDSDFSIEYIEKGIWRNGYTDKLLEQVCSIKVNDRIAIKTSFTRKHNLPFSSNGNTVSVMRIKIIGTVTKNHGDGRTLEVDWDKTFKPKDWYFFTNRTTIWKVESRSDDWLYQALLDFTFLNIPQDYSRFLEYPYWAEKYQIETNDVLKMDEGIELECNSNIEEYIETKLPAEIYTAEDFLEDVFMNEQQYITICELLRRKKNIILQGAPGVGKTFAARLLAYSIMGSTNEDRIKFIQFHQSYSYEDFIMGYKPDEKGFSLTKGVFYNFCKKAELQPDKEFFFIIDEINRGNMSKIFGELLMLIESDKRGAKNVVNLVYTGKPFSVPKNLYIIGMMNTADRSLAIIDYALRRRFCFIELAPAFSSSSFKEYLIKNGVDEAIVKRIIKNLTALNNDISEDLSLGKGFRIGHSYFCSCSDSSPEWYENIINYEIVPMLQEYWFDDEAKVKNWTDELLR